MARMLHLGLAIKPFRAANLSPFFKLRAMGRITESVEYRLEQKLAREFKDAVLVVSIPLHLY